MSELRIVGHIWPLLKPGIYTGVLDHHQTDASAFGGKPKVYMIFTLMDPGVFGIRVFRAYNVKAIVGRPKRNGAFQCSRRQDLTLHLANLSSVERPDRISLAQFRGREMKLKLRTVKMDYRQRLLPRSLRYSVVDEFSLLDTNDPCPET